MERLMNARETITPDDEVPDAVSQLLARYGCGPIRFAGAENALYERHLVFDKVIDPRAASRRDATEIWYARPCP
jgi:starch phosphorylase